MTELSMNLFLFGLSLVFGVVGWLLAAKDKKQAAEIDKLFAMVKEESEKRAALQLYIAGKHYERHELDSKFDKLDSSIKDGFTNLRQDMKEMMKELRHHVEHEHKVGQ